MILYILNLFVLNAEIALFEGHFFGLENSNPSHLVFISWPIPCLSCTLC